MRKIGDGCGSGRRRLNLGALVALALPLMTGCTAQPEKANAVSDGLRNQATAELRETLAAQPRFVKVHAAEALLQLGYPQDVTQQFQDELERHGEEPEYRIGVWRVLARAEANAEEKAKWITKIKGILLDESAPDRVHAAETLAKLSAQLTKPERAVAEQATESDDARLAAYSQWLLAASAEPGGDSRKSQMQRLHKLLESPDPTARGIAAYATRHLGQLSESRWHRLVQVAATESDPFIRFRMIGAALVTAPPTAPADELARLKSLLLQQQSSQDKKFRYELFQVLADCAEEDDLPTLKRGLRGDDAINFQNEGESGATQRDEAELAAARADLRAAAATAILRLDRRGLRAIGPLDWGVVAIYVLAMIAIGVYYSRKSKSKDDYLLGGRVMRPWMVGLSLFATLFSTLSYLSFPGEMIRHGPMMFAGLVTLPLVYLIIGWWLIPSIMSLKVTSGYELLEVKLGQSARLAGATIFLVLRLLWMATIIYATVDKALLPVLGVDAAYAPLISVIIGVVTLGYTSLGGLRAVVLTDVIQSFILMGGALATLALVTIHFGGIGGWFPSAWPSHWDPPRYGLGFQDRITFGNSIITILAWYVCTAGSDQMAIQRYLSTRDVAAARRSFGISLCATFFVKVLLGVVGLAVMAYFADQPHRLPDRVTLLTDADQLFSRFIVVGLPVGVSGLIISGIMAAAMSSLSSGVNSSSSVISEDYLKRFRPSSMDDGAVITQIRWITVLVGVAAVLLSFGVGYVQGNLFAVIMKVVNSLVAPLFILFFMAMFVPRATTFGTFAGLAASIAVSVGIAFFNVLDISFMWIMPGSLVVGAVVGVAASLATYRPSPESQAPGAA